MREWQVGDPVGDGNDIGVPDTKYMGYLNNDYADSDSSGSFELPRRDIIYKDSYNTYIELARKSNDDHGIINYYKKAVDAGLEYWKSVKELNLTGGDIPDKNHLLNREDINRCSKLHDKYLHKKSSIIFYNELRTLEQILTKSGNRKEFHKNYNPKMHLLNEKEWEEYQKKRLEEYKIKEAERKRKEKEECEKSPDCINEKIHQIDEQLKGNGFYAMLLGGKRLNFIQRKIDEAIGKKLRYLTLLENLGIEKNNSEEYIKKYIKKLKKENKRLKFFISRLDEEHSKNAKILLEKNNIKLDQLEKKSNKKRTKIKIF